LRPWAVGAPAWVMGQACCRRPDGAVFREEAPYQRGRERHQELDCGCGAGKAGKDEHQESWAAMEEYRSRDPLLFHTAPPAAVFRDDLPGEGLCSPSGVLAKCATYCCCAVCLAPLFLYLLVVLQVNFTVYGTMFTFSDYLQPVWNYLLAGMVDTLSLTQWYNGTTNGNPFIGEGPGPNTLMYYGWNEVRALLMDFGPRIRNGTMKRYHEMGVTIQNTILWPETGTVAMGYSNLAHAVVRPFLAAVLDAADRQHEACDGSTCWNSAWLRLVFRERLAGMEALSSRDLKWIVAAVLHKIHLNMDLSDEDAKRFAQFTGVFVLPQPLPSVMASSWMVSWLMDMPGILEFKRVLMEQYKKAIKKKWPQNGWESRPNDLVLLASAMCDSLALSGGLSVSAALDHMLALLHMRDSPAAPLKTVGLADVAVLHDFVLETLRRFPPVAGVPRWITDDGGKTWKHQIPNVGQALQDPRVFQRPLDFEPGRPGLNHLDKNLSIGWADFALVNGDVSNPDSHACPAKHLSIQLMVAFLQEFAAAGPWTVDNPDIELNMYSSSGFTLRKQQPTEGVPGAGSTASALFPHAPVPPLLRLCGWTPSLCKSAGIDLGCQEGPCAFF